MGFHKNGFLQSVKPSGHPLSVIVRGGYVNQNTSNLFANAGNNGYYWSSTPNSNGTNAYNLKFNGTTNVNPSNSDNRRNGFSVRCPRCARSPKPKPDQVKGPS